MTDQKEPPSDPQRLCIAANHDIACSVAEQASRTRGGCTVLIWTTEAPDTKLAGMIVPRIHKDGDKAPEDLACILAGYRGGKRLTGAEIEELNRRLTWTDAKKKRNRYKSTPAIDSEKTTPGGC